MPLPHHHFSRDRRVLITGGLGFIGSNLARSLVDLGADVLVVDSLIHVVDAFLRAGASDVVNADVFNVGGTEPISHRDLVELLIETAGAGSVRYVEWTAGKRAIDIGSFYSDSTKFQSAVGWRAEVPLREGFRRTVEYYRRHLEPYLEAES